MNSLGQVNTFKSNLNRERTAGSFGEKMDEYRGISKLLIASQSFVAMRGYQLHEAKTKNPHEMTKLRKSQSNKGI